MHPLEIAASFVEDAQRIPSLTSLVWKFQAALQNLGFQYYACGSHVDPLHPESAWMLLNYPQSWVEIYSERQLHKIDPVFLRAERAFDAFHWKADDFRRSASHAQQRMLREAHRFGIGRGFTIPIHAPLHASRLRGSCTIISDSNTLSSAHYMGAQLMANALFAATIRLKRLSPAPPPPTRLTRRQQQCLQLLADGNSEPLIARRLHLSPRTVRRHFEEAQLRLNSRSRSQLLLQALTSDQISFGNRSSALR